MFNSRRQDKSHKNKVNQSSKNQQFEQTTRSDSISEASLRRIEAFDARFIQLRKYRAVAAGPSERGGGQMDLQC
jgi:hypothetical protein